MQDPVSIDPETEFLSSTQESGYEWECFKENVKPLKRGRKINLLNDALKSHTDDQLKKSLLDKRRELIQAIDEYKGDDPLQPWLECIKWVQEAFPSGGDSSGLIVIYEQCARTFWDSNRYKDDLHYLKVWLDYAETCLDGEVIYSFLDVNKIGQTYSLYYISYALHLEAKNKKKKANEIYSIGIERKAKPEEKLKVAYGKFLARSLQKSKILEDDSVEDTPSVRNFGTILEMGSNSRLPSHENFYQVGKKLKTGWSNQREFMVYRDAEKDMSLVQKQDSGSNTQNNSWKNLGSRSDRNKENSTMPAKWSTFKIPQRVGFRSGGTTPSASIEVFVDEDCAKEMQKMTHSSTSFELDKGGAGHVNKEVYLLRQNPLRNFPRRSLLR